MWLVLLVPLIGPGVALLDPGRLAAHGPAWHVRRWGVLALAIQVVVLALAVGAAWYSGYSEREEAKRRAHEIQIAVERWGVDAQGGVPATLDELVQQGYLESVPINPYTKRALRCIPWGDPPSAGDVTYLPVFTAGNDQHYGGYVLIVYGPRCYAGEDIDGDGTKDQVLACLSGSGLWPRDVIKAYRGQPLEGWTTVPPPNRVIPTASGS